MVLHVALPTQPIDVGPLCLSKNFRRKACDQYKTKSKLETPSLRSVDKPTFAQRCPHLFNAGFLLDIISRVLFLGAQRCSALFSTLLELFGGTAHFKFQVFRNVSLICFIFLKIGMSMLVFCSNDCKNEPKPLF